MPLEDLLINNAKIKADVADVVVGLSFSVSTTQVAQVTLRFMDFQDMRLLASGLFNKGSKFRYRGVSYDIAALQVQGNSGTEISVSARSSAAQAFKKTKTAIVRTDISPTDFLKVEAALVGGRVVAQETSKRASISRVNNENQQESTWDVMQKLANEVGYLFFEVYGTFYFGRPTWMVGRSVSWYATFDAGLTSYRRHPNETSSNSIEIFSFPDCRRSEDDKYNIATIDMIVDRKNGIKVKPGDVVIFSGVPQFEGRYMVQNMSWDGLSDTSPVSMNLVTPIDPKVRSTTGSAPYDGPLNIVDDDVENAFNASNPSLDNFFNNQSGDTA